MSSSNSIAAARNRRAGSQAPPPTPQTRPGTSIASHSAFAQQNGNNSSNARNPKMQQSSMKPPGNVQQNNGMPFTKLTISDAVGLITLRLGRVEQFMIDLNEERNNGDSQMGNLPDNTKLIDNSVLTSMINRLDALEKKDLISTNNDQIAKLEKELREAKDLLLNVMFKIDNYMKDTNDKLGDYESAIEELEKNIFMQSHNLVDNNLVAEESSILTTDLKDIVTEENSISEES